MRWVAVVVGFLMLVAPAVGPGSNVFGLLFAFGGAFAGGLLGSIVTSLPMGLRLRRAGADRAASALFGVLGVAAMVCAPFAKGLVGALLPTSDEWYGGFEVAWLFVPQWFAYGVMVGFGVVALLLGGAQEATMRSGGGRTPGT